MAPSEWAIPCPPNQTFKLSSWDKRYPPMYSKRILCFPLSDRSSSDRIMQSLLNALTSAVNMHAPVLAGTIVPGEQPWLYDLKMDGSAHLKMRDLSGTLKYSTLKERNFSQDLLDADELCFFPKPSYRGADRLPVCAIQANFVHGGLLLTFEMIHVAFDGRAITDIMELLALKMRTESSPGVEVPEFQDRSDHSLMPASLQMLGDLSLHSGLAQDSGTTPSKAIDASHNVKAKIFSVPANSVSTLKKLANDGIRAEIDGNINHPNGSDSSINWASTHDSLVALIWQSVMKARVPEGMADKDSEATCAIPFDYRKAIGLPKPYLGNAIYPIQPEMKTDSLTSASGFARAALAIRRTIAGVDADRIHDVLALQERVHRQRSLPTSIHDKLATTAMFVTSYFSFPVHEMDFGNQLGKVESFRLPGRGFTPGLQIVMPKRKDGSVDILICEPEQAMNRILRDDFFMSFAQPV